MSTSDLPEWKRSDPPPTRLVLLGGFLGAGKTTTLVRLARRYLDLGSRVGIVTNDQGDGLVDTRIFDALGFATREVAGGCFCCRFDDLLRRADELIEVSRPDVLLAEPVGSCTDLLATVIRPMQRLHGDRFAISPLVTVVDPLRALVALGIGGAKTGSSTHQARGRGRLSEKITYIFRMQQQEADGLAINKIDLVDPSERGRLRAALAERFPSARIIEYSARSGVGFDELAEFLDGGGIAGGVPVPEIDYDMYAEGEAELGWLNRSCRLLAEVPVGLDEAVIHLAERIRAEMLGHGLEIAHAKVLLRGDRFTAVANVTSTGAPAELSQGATECASSLELAVNLRVQGAPSDLEESLNRALEAWCGHFRLARLHEHGAAFSPDRPVPTHRIGDP